MGGCCKRGGKKGPRGGRGLISCRGRCFTEVTVGWLRRRASEKGGFVVGKSTRPGRKTGRKAGEKTRPRSPLDVRVEQQISRKGSLDFDILVLLRSPGRQLEYWGGEGLSVYWASVTSGPKLGSSPSMVFEGPEKMLGEKRGLGGEGRGRTGRGGCRGGGALQ